MTAELTMDVYDISACLNGFIHLCSMDFSIEKAFEFDINGPACIMKLKKQCYSEKGNLL